MMPPKTIKYRAQELTWGLIAIISGAAVCYIGLHILLKVRLDVFYGVQTFNYRWVMGLFLVPFVGGILVSLVYGLGGKIAAHFSPILVLVPDYLGVKDALLPEGVSVLPFGFWFLILIVAMEFSALGGIVGEVLVRKTYGRSPKYMLHKKHQQPEISLVEVNHIDRPDLREDGRK